MRPKLEQFTQFVDYYSSPGGDEKLSLPQWAKAHGVSVQLVYYWRKKIKNNIPAVDAFDELMSVVKARALHIKGTFKDRELYARLNGWMIEKKEEVHKFEFTPGEYARIARETIEGLREQYRESKGRCPVCGQSPLLCSEVLDFKPEHETDREMAAVAVSP